MSDFEVRLAVLEQKLEDMNHDLYGNGQPGMIGNMAIEIKNLADKLNRLTTVVAVIAAGSGGVAGYAVKALLGQVG